MNPSMQSVKGAASGGYIRNCWYVIAWSHEVQQDAPFARRVLDQSVVLYRSEDGSINALEDRCCHRHAPLSFGRVEGNALRCMYHGLLFGADGRCLEIPGQASVPAAARVRSFPVIERRRWIWIWMGDPSKSDPALIPDTFSLDDPAWRMKPGYMHYDASHDLITDNLLDFSHLSFVHEKSLGGTTQIAETRAHVDLLSNGVRLTRRVHGSVPAPYHVSIGAPRGPVDRWWIYDYLIPGVLLLDSGVRPAGTTGDVEGMLHFHSCQAITPSGPKTTHYFFMQAHSFKLDDADITEHLYQSVVGAFGEDRRMIEAQQAIIDSNLPAPMLGLPMDAALAQYRRLYGRILQSEASA